MLVALYISDGLASHETGICKSCLERWQPALALLHHMNALLRMLSFILIPALLQFMVAYQLLMSIGINVMLFVDGSEFSVIQVSL